MKVLLENRIFSFFIIIFLLLLPGIVPANQEAKQSPRPLMHHEHVLVGRIYDVKNDRFINESDLLQSLSIGKYILLGETHDNIRHHQIQKRVMRHIASEGDSISLSLEMLDSEQANTLGDINNKRIGELMTYLNETDTGWDYKAYYKGLFAVALQENIQIFPANLTRQALRHIMRNKGEDLSPTVSQLMVDTGFSESMIDNLRKELVDSHCGMLDANSAEPMLLAQRVRDVRMALSMLSTGADKRLLLAGTGHVRNDRGVPLYLAERIDSNETRTLAMIEVEEDSANISDYVTWWDSNTFPFDYVWFTTRADREDPCLAFKKRK